MIERRNQGRRRTNLASIRRSTFLDRFLRWTGAASAAFDPFRNATAIEQPHLPSPLQTSLLRQCNGILHIADIPAGAPAFLEPSKDLPGTAIVTGRQNPIELVRSWPPTKPAKESAQSPRSRHSADFPSDLKEPMTIWAISLRRAPPTAGYRKQRPSHLSSSTRFLTSRKVRALSPSL